MIEAIIEEIGEYRIPSALMNKPLQGKIMDVAEIYQIREPGYFGIKPRGIVTSEWLNDDVILTIQPKFGTRNCFELLLQSEELPNMVEEKAILSSDIQESTIWSLLANRFIMSLEEVRSKGLIWEDQDIEIVSTSLMGNANYPDSLIESFNQLTPVIVQTIQHSDYSSIENVSLATALKILLNYRHLLDDETKASLEKEWAWWEQIPVDGKVVYDLRKTMNTKIPSERSYYYTPLTLATIILENMGPSGSVTKYGLWHPIRYDMDRIFEKVCINWTRVGVRRNGIAMNWTEYSSAYGPPLFFKTVPLGGKNIELQPDIIITSLDSAEPLMILDAKYKFSPDQGDHYQIAAYAEAFNVNVCGFVHIGCGNAVSCYETKKGLKIDKIQLDLTEISKAKDFFIDYLKNKIPLASEQAKRRTHSL